MKNRARDMFFDFLEVALLVGLVIFAFVYVIIGNRLGMLAKFFENIFSLFFFIFLAFSNFSINRRRLRKYRREQTLHDTIFYLDENDAKKDIFVIGLSTFAIFLLPYFDRSFYLEDALQTGIFLALALGWHFYIFKMNDYGNAANTVNGLELILDRIFIFFLPVIVILVAVAFGDTDIIDFAQALAAMGFMFFWRMILFREKGKF